MPEVKEEYKEREKNQQNKVLLLLATFKPVLESTK